MRRADLQTKRESSLWKCLRDVGGSRYISQVNSQESEFPGRTSTPPRNPPYRMGASPTRQGGLGPQLHVKDPPHQRRGVKDAGVGVGAGVGAAVWLGGAEAHVGSRETLPRARETQSDFAQVESVPGIVVDYDRRGRWGGGVLVRTWWAAGFRRPYW